MNYEIPHFIIKANLQKSAQTNKYFSDSITQEVLEDICLKITGLKEYSVDFVENDYQDDVLNPTYNQGRLIILKYQNSIKYISVSEEEIVGRNSSIQSVPTAFNLYYLSLIENKDLYYYFLDIKEGNPKTDYHLFIYRLMATIGFKFLNPEKIDVHIEHFYSINDLMLNRKANAQRKRNNNSTYVTKNTHSEIEIYGKTYGANKYETSLICYAISLIAKINQTVILYEILEKDLKELPKPSLDVIKKIGKINKIIPLSKSLNKNQINEGLKLRSARYIFNLLERIGDKKCALCDCAIPEIIQGAHIWEVSSIRKDKFLSKAEKYQNSVSGDNGIWLCSNHHKLFDENIIRITPTGDIEFNTELEENLIYLKDITKFYKLSNHYLNDSLVNYIIKRYALEKIA